MTSLTHLHPIGVGDLPDGMRACADCGMPTDAGAHEVAVYGHREPVLFGLCDDCAARHTTAQAIIAANPGVGRLGSPHILADRLGAALTAIAAIGQTPPPVEAWTATMIADALNRLSTFSGTFAGITWLALFAPAKVIDAIGQTRYVKSDLDPGSLCASQPWLFVPADSLAEARTGFVEWCVDRLPPRPIPSPTGACALCGIGVGMGRRPAEAWRTVTSGPLTGGHLCTTCAPAYESNQPLAVSVDAAVLAHLDPERRHRRKGPTAPRMTGVRPWADTGRPPSSRPWAHVDLTQPLRALQGGIW